MQDGLPLRLCGLEPNLKRSDSYDLRVQDIIECATNEFFGCRYLDLVEFPSRPAPDLAVNPDLVDRAGSVRDESVDRNEFREPPPSCSERTAFCASHSAAAESTAIV
jgi:hypothetical protein